MTLDSNRDTNWLYRRVEARTSDDLINRLVWTSLRSSRSCCSESNSLSFFLKRPLIGLLHTAGLDGLRSGSPTSHLPRAVQEAPLFGTRLLLLRMEASGTTAPSC